MQVSCNEDVASHVGPESCGGDCKVVIEALTGEDAGRVSSLENVIFRSADAVASVGRQQRTFRYRKERSCSAWSETPCTRRSISLGSREVPGLAVAVAPVRAVNPKGVRRQ